MFPAEKKKVKYLLLGDRHVMQARPGQGDGQCQILL